MGIYTDMSVIDEIEKTHRIISEKISKNKKYRINELSSEEEKEDFINSILWAAWSDFYRIFTNRRELLDKNTSFNQEVIPEQIKFSREYYINNKIPFLSNLIRLMYEFYFWIGREREQIFLEYDTLTMLDNLFDPSEILGAQFGWIRDYFVVTLVRSVLNSDGFEKAKSLIKDIDHKKYDFTKEVDDLVKNKFAYFSDSISSTYTKSQEIIRMDKEKINDMVVDINGKVEEINALADKVSKMRTEYNFVALSSAFAQIKEKKEDELRTVEVYYQNLFGCIFIAPVLAVILHFLKKDFFPTDISALFIIFPILTIELALIYFFRLSYLEGKSIRTQLVQIELRLSLCAFVEGYVDYRKKVEMKDPDLFKLFDAMIFSPIQVNENNIPSMFDGVEAIANLVDKVK